MPLLSTSSASHLRRSLTVALPLLCAVLLPQSAHAQSTVAPTRVIQGDLSKVKGKRDQSFRLCVGSAHAGMLLHKENLAQLTRVHRELGFEFVRFHGIFTDDMDVYHEKDGQPVYNWNKIDALYDSILATGMKPFVELSFMPNDLASGGQQMFFWNANVTPPKDTTRWAALVEAFVRHLQARYGHDQVKQWYFEVWNEPNYPGFWPGANQQAYFTLYDATSAAIKRVSQDYRVGGPATAGAGWVPEFIQHTQAAHAPVDFLSTHTYAVSQGFLDADGKADLVLSSDPQAITGDVKNVHQQIQKSAAPNLPLYITEWSSSYSSRDPVHDSYTGAAFVLDKLKQTEGLASAMSYWTYSDLFEENGPPPAAFHGGFGLLTRDNVPKATYFAYKYLRELGDTELQNADARSWLTKSGDDVQVLLWDFSLLPQTEGDKAFYRRLHPPADALSAELQLAGMRPGSYEVEIYKTGYNNNEAYSSYLQMGMPKDLSADQLRRLEQQTADQPVEHFVVKAGADGKFSRLISLRSNDVVFVTLHRR
jgi:xylan 1,4-beta-xylosidase